MLLLTVGYLSIDLFVGLVSEDEEREVVRVLRVRFHEEVLAPERQVLKASRVRDVIDEHACLCTSVECDAQTLISLLASRVPDLKKKRHKQALYLERDSFLLPSFLELELFGVEICANGRLVHLRDTLPDVTTD